MKRLKTILILCALACQPGLYADGQPHRRITLHGVCDPYQPDHFICKAGTLEAGTDYVLHNDTTNTVYLFLVAGRTPLEYGMVQPGDEAGFQAPTGCDSLDLFLRGSEGVNLNGKGGLVLREGLEIATD